MTLPFNRIEYWFLIILSGFIGIGVLTSEFKEFAIIPFLCGAGLLYSFLMEKYQWAAWEFAYECFRKMDMLTGRYRYLGNCSQSIITISRGYLNPNWLNLKNDYEVKMLAQTNKGNWFVYTVLVKAMKVKDEAIIPLSEDQAAMLVNQYCPKRFHQYFGEPEIA